MLVRGDKGLNNVLLDPDDRQVIAVLDWEWAHAEDPIEDLAWCEWVVRMNHPDDVDASMDSSTPTVTAPRGRPDTRR